MSSGVTIPRPERIATSDLGVIPFPHFCAEWCDEAAHIQYATEDPAHTSASAATSCRRGGGEVVLRTLTHRTDSRIERRGGGGYMLEIGRDLLNPADEHSGFASFPLIGLTVEEAGERAVVRFTSGEARVLAFHLMQLCDAVDGAHR